MLAERTYWEKATAIHVFCRQQRMRGERKSRHWHDLTRLDEAGIAETALQDRELALSVARHKDAFFTENDAKGQRINYEAAVSGNLQIVPSGDAYAALEEDYEKMLKSGMPLEQNSFEPLMQQCAAIETRASKSIHAGERR